MTSVCCAGDLCRQDAASRILSATQTDSMRRLQGATTPGHVGGQVRRQSGPPRVTTRLSNQETQILMTTINGQTSAAAAADDLAADE